MTNADHELRRPPRLHQITTKRDRPLFFITFCVQHRRPILNCESVHESFLIFCRVSPQSSSVFVGRYVIMPDHVHLFVTAEDSTALQKWVASLKRHMNWCLNENGNAPPFWQQGFFDHVLRSGEPYSEKWRYVEQNPVRAGLVATAEDWPFAGELERLEL